MLAAVREYHNIVELLISNGADVNDVNARADDGTTTLILLATGGEYNEIIKLLASQGSHVDISKNDKFTAFWNIRPKFILFLI
jgi:ankyrin repeat protein